MIQQKNLDHYSILESLGAGGMGEVFRAHDTRLRRDVALKIMRPDGPVGQASVRRILSEARAIASLQHPNICAVHAVSESDGIAYIDMELIEGRSLQDALPDRGFPAERSLEIARQLAAALDHAHSRKVVHRDLKGANVMLTPSGQVKVLDFGLALHTVEASPDGSTVLLDSLAQEGQIVGTVPYMSPEVLSGRVADERSDLWSLGVLLHEIAVGHRPFTGETVFELTGQIQNLPAPNLPRRVPAGLRRVVARCLEKDPAKRYGSAAELLRDLDATRAPRIPALASRIALALAGTLVAAFALSQFHLTCSPASGPSADHITVFPFRVAGSPDLAYLGTGMVDLLYPLLDGAGELRATPPSRVLREVGNGGTPPDPDAARTLAAGFGSGSFILGTIVRIGDEFRITGELYDGSDVTEPVQTASITAASEEDLARSVDDLARELLRRRLPETAYDRSIETNLASLRAYLRGEHEIREGRFEEAEANYEQAVDGDSTFAQAWLGLALTRSMNLKEEEGTVAALEQALSRKDRLSPLMQKHLMAEYYATTEISERPRPLLQEIVSEDPADFRARFRLADWPFHYAPLLGGRISEGLDDLLLARDMGYPEDVVYLWHERVAQYDAGNRAGYVQALTKVRDGFPESEFQDWARVELAFATGNAGDRQAALAGLARGNDVFTFLTAQSMIGFGFSLEGAAAIAPILVEPGRPDPVRLRGHLIRAALAETFGRHEESGREIEAMARLSPDNALAYEAFFLLTPGRPVSTTELADLAARLEAWSPPPPPPGQPDAIWDPHAEYQEAVRLHLLGLARANLQEPGRALEIADRLALPPHPDSVATLPEVLAQSVRAEVARLAGHREEALEFLRPKARRNYWLLNYMTPFASLSRERFLTGQLLAESGRGEEALDWLYGSSRYATADVVFRAPALALRGSILEDLGRPGDAVEAYHSLLALWDGADPVHAEEIERIRDRITLLEGR